MSAIELTLAPVPPGSLRGQPSLGAAVDDDLELVQRSKANLLVIGSPRAVMTIINMVVPELNPDLLVRCEKGPFRLPQSSAADTVVFRDVDALNADEQNRLWEWLNAAGNRRQVISTAAAPLLPLVEAREFNASLYYRLNTVYIDLSE